MEFLGIMGTTEYYKGEIEAFYAVHNPAKLEGERHKTKLDSLLWKYKGRERKLLNKIKRKYDEEQKAGGKATGDAEDAGEAGGARCSRRSVTEQGWGRQIKKETKTEQKRS